MRRISGGAASVWMMTWMLTPRARRKASPDESSASSARFQSPPQSAASRGREAAQDAVRVPLFGYRKGRVSFSIQENPRTLPTAVVELAMQTHALQREMGAGMVRIAMECEKRPAETATDEELQEEPLWMMFCNGKKSGYAVKREAADEDLQVMELLRAVSMGEGVLPGRSEVEGPDGEIAYMRAHFDRVVGSKDSETLYMVSPDGNTGPDLSIFFVRLG
ncbi:hypothetical protein SASPL_143613 [Salvia splendens]|uniref:Protein MIZU-KUSSEI 1 n=1 Tax=Salvia splendens TaxID=180675 RepID=A0A8X8WMI8_SALSN|nr:hypothetical protein SASPL_143613 [Salvia splendens]